MRECFIKWKAEIERETPSTSTGIEKSFEVERAKESIDNEIQVATISLVHNSENEQRCKDLTSCIKKSLNGRAILAKFTENNFLSPVQKGFVIREAVELLLHNIPKFPEDFPRQSDYNFACKEIESLFPGEFTTTELLGHKKIDSNGKLLKKTRGKLAQRIYDIAKTLKKKKAPSNAEDAIVVGDQIEDDAEMDFDNDHEYQNTADDNEIAANALKFIKNNMGPESKILIEWEKSAALRKKQYFSDYPSLTSTFGSKLIMWDFEHRHPGKSAEFKRQFESLKQKMMFLFESSVTDIIGIELLSNLKSTQKKEIENYLYLAILPYLFQPVATRRNNMTKRSVSTSSDYFFCRVEVSF